MKVKLTKLHKENAHNWSGIGHRHESSRSLYAYKQYRIKTDDYYMGWFVCHGDGERLSPFSPNMSFKEVRQWLEDYLKEKNNEL